jgi:hypothetical protein
MERCREHAVWRACFIDAMRLVGAAAGRLPVGVMDPILCGESAIELYTGGLFAADALELYATQPRLLTAELFGAGFRWTESRPGSTQGLWHPDLQMALNIIDDRDTSTTAGLANLLTVVMDVGGSDWVPTSLKVIGIEDTIARQVTPWRTHLVPSGRAVALIQVLLALSRRGIGGPFRSGYLQRRLSHETGGEIAIESLSPGEGVEHDTAPRMMALSK